MVRTTFDTKQEPSNLAEALDLFGRSTVAFFEVLRREVRDAGVIETTGRVRESKPPRALPAPREEVR